MEAERRQVTVLFTDMVGFTAFSERQGEEAAYTLMRSLSKLMDESVREHGGVVQGFTGDGIMAVFGAPVAVEDAPLRACRTALSILQRIKVAAPELEAKHGVRPQLRIGLNTGAAVVGKVQEGADAQVTVLGDKPFLGVHKLLQGNIGEGIRVIEETVSRREREGHITNANFWRLNLAEVYLRIIAGNEKPSLGVLLKNLPILLKVMVTGSSRIRTLMARNREHPSDHPDSFHTGKVEMILGLLYKAKKKRALTVQHLTEAQRILSQFGQTPTLARVESGASGIGTIAPLRSVTNRLRATKPHQAHCTPPEAA